MASPYTYNAEVVRVVDGDTLILDVDLGFKLWLRDQSFRLLGVNAREHSQVGGKEAKHNLAKLLAPTARVQLTSVRADKYGGRYDAIVTMSDGEDLASLLVETGWASPWNGAGARPVPAWPRTDPVQPATRPGPTA